MEAICLAAGAKHVTTVEYNQLTFDHEQLTTITAAEFAKREAEFAHSFDVAISLSRWGGASTAPRRLCMRDGGLHACVVADLSCVCWGALLT